MEARRKGLYVFILAGLAVAVALALLVSPWASSSPDGLEKVAEDKGFLEKAEETEPAWESAPIPDYAMPGLTREAVDEETGEVVEEPTKLATALAGLVGTVAIFLIAWGLALVLKKRTPDEANTVPR
ncbi:MAG: PDGLE domain-containing protein [Actinobacteria bacterium]|nr:PDGLE domain-containing protein [Actinomycetota bacterium]